MNTKTKVGTNGVASIKQEPIELTGATALNCLHKTLKVLHTALLNIAFFLVGVILGFLFVRLTGIEASVGGILLSVASVHFLVLLARAK